MIFTEFNSEFNNFGSKNKENRTGRVYSSFDSIRAIKAKFETNLRNISASKSFIVIGPKECNENKELIKDKIPHLNELYNTKNNSGSKLDRIC